jgi:DNA-binding Xre family transcriptional regulator
MFKYDKLFKLFEDNGINSYTVRKLNLMSGRAYQAVRDGTADLSVRSIGTLCEYFGCQPNDILEYVPEKIAS